MSKWFAALAIVLALCITLSGQTFRSDMAWWNHISSDEQDGFILGFYDCHGSPQGPRNASTDALRKFLQRAAIQNPSDSIPSLLRIAKREMHEPPPARGGEHYAGKHGWLDGEWWGVGLDGHENYQTGYVEGYLACRGEGLTSKKVMTAVTGVNRRYKKVADTTAVADVIDHVLTEKAVKP